MKKKLLFATALMLCAGSMMAQPAQWSKPQVLIKSSQSLMAPVWIPDGSKIAVTGDTTPTEVRFSKFPTSLEQATK